MSAIRILSTAERVKMAPWLVENNLTAKLRWPYLYRGDAAETERIIRGYLAHRGCVVAMAFDGDRPIAAEMSNWRGVVPLPITDDLTRFLARAGTTLARTWWANWLIVEPEARGQDIGRRLIAASEAAIRALGGDVWLFDVLMRPPGHPAAPLDWRPESQYFGHVGFVPAPLPPTPSEWVDIEPAGMPATRKFYRTYWRDLRV